MLNRKTARLAAVAALGLFVSACQQYQWVHPVRSTADYGRDRFNCERRAVSLYPTTPAVVQDGGGYFAGGGMSCYRDYWGGRVCRSAPPLYVPPTYSTRDLNAAPREEAIKACLYGQGYQLVPIKS